MTPPLFILVCVAMKDGWFDVGLVEEYKSDFWSPGDVIHLAWTEQTVPPLGTTFELKVAS